jgi:hypothetical protein
MILAMTTPSRQQLREWSAAFTLGPLAPAGPKETRYVPLADAGRAAVDELLATIELEDAGFHAAIFDIGTYVNESSPIDVTEFLIALALGANDVLSARNGPRTRLRHEVAPSPGPSQDLPRRPGLSATVSREGPEVEAMGASVEVDPQRELKSSEGVVAELRSKLTYHIGSCTRRSWPSSPRYCRRMTRARARCSSWTAWKAGRDPTIAPFDPRQFRAGLMGRHRP